MRSLAAALAAFVLIAAVPAFADQEPPAQVGRVSFIEGTLAFHTEGEAAHNRLGAWSGIWTLEGA